VLFTPVRSCAFNFAPLLLLSPSSEPFWRGSNNSASRRWWVLLALGVGMSQPPCLGHHCLLGISP